MRVVTLPKGFGGHAWGFGKSLSEFQVVVTLRVSDFGFQVVVTLRVSGFGLQTVSYPWGFGFRVSGGHLGFEKCRTSRKRVSLTNTPGFWLWPTSLYLFAIHFLSIICPKLFHNMPKILLKFITRLQNVSSNFRFQSIEIKSRVPGSRLHARLRVVSHQRVPISREMSFFVSTLGMKIITQFL